jgi:hypothetical protein
MASGLPPTGERGGGALARTPKLRSGWLTELPVDGTSEQVREKEQQSSRECLPPRPKFAGSTPQAKSASNPTRTALAPKPKSEKPCNRCLMIFVILIAVAALLGLLS